MREDRTPTTIMVDILNMEQICGGKEAVECAEDAGYDRLDLFCSRKWGLVTDGKKHWVVCAEGVFWGPYSVQEEHRFELHGVSEMGTSMLPIAANMTRISDLIPLKTGEAENLADFVRRFGTRLESNYYKACREMA